MNRPYTTLFMIQSLDGKITTGDSDVLDIDKDFKRISGVKEGLHQYYELEKQTDWFSLNTGRVMAKIGVNTRPLNPIQMTVNFIIIDDKPHLNAHGVEYLSKWVQKLYLVTSNKNHPAYQMKKSFPNIEIVEFENKINLQNLLILMKEKYGVDRITIQSGGTINTSWIREGLIDRVSIVIAPCLIGGSNTQGLLGGESLHNENELLKIKSLKLIQCDVLKDSYLHLQYDVFNETKIDSE